MVVMGTLTLQVRDNANIRFSLLVVKSHQHQQDRFLARGKFETVMDSTILLKEKDMRFSFKNIWVNTRTALTVLVWREEGVGRP